MNKFKFYFILSITTLSLFSCSKNDAAAEITPPREFGVQYTADITDIEEYLKTNYITVVNNPGAADDQDVTISKITNASTQPSIYSYLNKTSFPKLLSRDVSLHNITYKLYYLVLREGTGQSPSNVDGVFTSYRGDYLQRDATTKVLSTTKFTDIVYPQKYEDLYTLIRGWKEIFPQFKTGNYNDNADGTVSYSNFGAGVMFIPSGLGYYSSGSGSIPAYVPLVFSFKLYEIERLDHEVELRNGAAYPAPDGIPSYLEDLDGDGYMWTKSELPDGAVNPDDTDGDGVPDFLDIDDDGDGYTTKLEITNPATGLAYPFANIPTCASGKKNYLDASCHP